MISSDVVKSAQSADLCTVCDCVNGVCVRSLIISLLVNGGQMHFRWSILPVIPSIDSPSSLCAVPESGPFGGTAFLLPIPSVTAAVFSSKSMVLKRLLPESRAWVLFYGRYININTLWLLLDKKVTAESLLSSNQVFTCASSPGDGALCRCSVRSFLTEHVI